MCPWARVILQAYVVGIKSHVRIEMMLENDWLCNLSKMFF